MFAMVAWDSLPGSHDAGQVALEQGDAGALDGHVGARPHRKADVGGGQGRGVVDAVARHGHDAALVAQPLDDVGLVVGQHLGLDPVDAEAASDGLGGDPVVAGEHDDLDPVGAQRLEGGGGGLLDRVGDGDDPGDLVVDADEDDRGAVGAQPVGLARSGRSGRALGR